MKKKLFTLFVLVLSFTLLTGCFNRPPSLKDRIADAQQENEEDLLSYTGVIEPLEFDVYRQGTHQIRTDDNELIAIQSREIDLNRYLEKRVTVKGSYGETIGNAVPALNVAELILDPVYSEEGEPQLYENKSFAFRFTYPYGWELTEQERGLQLRYNGHEWVSLEVITTTSSLDKYVGEHEEGEGTPVTIGAQRSLRFIDGSIIRLYIPNPSKSKIYKIVFNEAGRDVGQEKEAFYDLLESFEPLYFASRTGDPCGGKEDLKCAEDYRCELESGEKDAEGVCVPVDATVTEQPCPFIASPECDHYRVSQYSALGCPTRYECVEGGTDLSMDQGEIDIDALTGTVERYAKTLLSASDPILLQYEVSKEAGLIAVVYKEGDKKLKTLFSFTPSANEFNFVEKAHFEEGDGEWEIVSGKDEQQGVSKTVIQASGDDDSSPRAVSENKRLYENEREGFSLGYPKDWYYRNFGNLNDNRWTVGFADKELGRLSDSLITVSIVDEIQPSTSFYQAHKKRDEDSFYLVEGDEEYAELIEEILESIR